MRLSNPLTKARVTKPADAPSSWPTEYNELVLKIEHEIELYYFIAASVFSWLLLAGYLVSPSSYASLQQSDVLKGTGDISRSVFGVVRNVPLLWIASFACLVAIIGLTWLSITMWKNCVWLKRYVVGPVMFNSGMGLLSTIVNVYSMQDGNWSITAVITGSIILGLFVLSATYYSYLELVKLPRLSVVLRPTTEPGFRPGYHQSHALLSRTFYQASKRDQQKV